MNENVGTDVNTTLPGFDTEFTSLDDYIRVITARIWEGRHSTPSTATTAPTARSSLPAAPARA